MKSKPKIKTPQPGMGHKARVAVVAKIMIEQDGKKQSFNIDYDVTITVEMIDYAIKQIATGIAKAADRVSKDGITGIARDLRKERKEDLGVSNPISE